MKGCPQVLPAENRLQQPHLEAPGHFSTTHALSTFMQTLANTLPCFFAVVLFREGAR